MEEPATHSYRDFAFGKRRIPGLKAMIAVAVITLSVVGLAEGVWHARVVAPRDQARDDAWQIKGPPCLQLDPAQFDLHGGARAAKVTDFGARFTRQYGHVDCTWMGDTGGAAQNAYPICQFTGPNVIKVETSKGVFRFVPGVGQPATVEVHHGIARCVLAANFRG